MSGSVSMVPQSIPFDLAHENMLLDDLSGQPLEPDFFSKVLSLPMASSTPVSYTHLSTLLFWRKLSIVIRYRC